MVDQISKTVEVVTVDEVDKFVETFDIREENKNAWQENSVAWQAEHGQPTVDLETGQVIPKDTEPPE
jgi:hypothetical protein